jgi:hypothetical protein
MFAILRSHVRPALSHDHRARRGRPADCANAPARTVARPRVPSTAPYLSFAGAHLPRLKVHAAPDHRPRAASERSGSCRRAPGPERPAHENSFIRAARRGEIKHDDLLEKVRVSRLRRQIVDAGLRIVREELHVTATVRRLPAAVGRWLRDSALTQDALISNMEYVLARGPGAE